MREIEKKENVNIEVKRYFIFFLPILYYVHFLEDFISLREFKIVNVKNRNIKTNPKLHLTTELNFYRKIPYLHF